MVEVDILTECVHNNIVGIKEAFFFDHKLWVCEWGIDDVGQSRLIGLIAQYLYSVDIHKANMMYILLLLVSK